MGIRFIQCWIWGLNSISDKRFSKVELVLGSRIRPNLKIKFNIFGLNSFLDMMRPKSAMFYLDKLQEIGDEFVAYIRRERDRRSDGTIPDFLLPCHRYALESITAIALDTRLGCLESEIPQKVESYMKSIDGIMKTFPRMIISFPFWKYFPPRFITFHFSYDNQTDVVSFRVFFIYAIRKCFILFITLRSHSNNTSHSRGVVVYTTVPPKTWTFFLFKTLILKLLVVKSLFERAKLGFGAKTC